MWRQQEAYLTALNRYCVYVLSKESSPETVANILEGLGPLEKEEILRQNGIEYSEVPAWQRRGAGVSLASDNRVSVETNLPEDSAYRPFLQQFLG
jgi:tRNA(His) 5'-end guanylyltransferase